MVVLGLWAIKQTSMKPAQCFTEWLAFQKGEDLAHEIFILSGPFPREEKYSLTDQIRRCSRSVCTNLAEGHAKRRYPRHFYAKLTDALGENNETLVWLRFARKCKYINNETYLKFAAQNAEVGKLLNYMIKNPERFGQHKLGTRN